MPALPSKHSKEAAPSPLPPPSPPHTPPPLAAQPTALDECGEEESLLEGGRALGEGCRGGGSAGKSRQVLRDRVVGKWCGGQDGAGKCGGQDGAVGSRAVVWRVGRGSGQSGSGVEGRTG